MTLLLRFLLLVVRAHQVYPSAPMALVAPAVREAVEAEDVMHVPAELLIAITEHESDWQPDAISFRSQVNGRVDMLLHTLEPPYNGIPDRVVCGYMQAMAHDRTDCAVMISLNGGMVRGAGEIREWMTTCKGNVRCALSGHAGGNAGVAAWRAGKVVDATMFAAHFYWMATRLGWNERSRGAGS